MKHRGVWTVDGMDSSSPHTGTTEPARVPWFPAHSSSPVLHKASRDEGQHNGKTLSGENDRDDGIVGRLDVTLIGR
jgi:hypothetical protein